MIRQGEKVVVRRKGILVVGIVVCFVIFVFWLNSTQNTRNVTTVYRYNNLKSTPDYYSQKSKSEKLSEIRNSVMITVREVRTDSAATYAKCVVKNNGNRTYKYIKVKGSFMNYEGDVILTGNTYAVGSEGLSPNESTEFSLYSSGRNSDAVECQVVIYDYD